MVPEKKKSKFEEEDLPKILATLKRAREMQMSSRVTVDFSSDGGVLGIVFESKLKVK